MSDIPRRTFMLGAVAAAATLRSQRSNSIPAVQRSTLVVNGLDPSRLTAEYLDLLDAGGVHCWHHSVRGDFAGFASLLAMLALSSPGVQVQRADAAPGPATAAPR